MQQKIRIGLLIDEYFGGAGTAFGGYGFLARNFIAKYIPDENIELEVLLEMREGIDEITSEIVDDIVVWIFPRDEKTVKNWFEKQNFDLFLSIELTWPSWELLKLVDNIKLVLWIQDPRPSELWDERRNSMSIIQDPCICAPQVSNFVNALFYQDKVKFISQGKHLNSRAFQLYNLPSDAPVQILRNPTEIDFNYNFDINKKKKQVVFLGRIEAQKRAWLFCEVAKLMPEYEFYVLGGFFRHEDENRRALEQYLNDDIPNLRFLGHVEGERKNKLLRESRILLNTSIWEGIPISWLECLQYGTLVVSCVDNENLPSRFGSFVGEIYGDGYGDVEKFVSSIKIFMENDQVYTKKAIEAIEYIRKNHTIEKFQEELKDVLFCKFIINRLYEREYKNAPTEKESIPMIRASKFNYFRYTLLSKITFGKTAKRYEKKRMLLKLRSNLLDEDAGSVQTHDSFDLSKLKTFRLASSLKTHYFRKSWSEVFAFENLWIDFEDHLFKRLEKFRKKVIPWLKSTCFLQKASILEIGCGTGSFTVALGETGAKITAIDISESSIEVAKERCRIYEITNVQFHALNSEQMENSFSEQFDLVVFSASLEHMTYRERIQSITAAYKATKMGGIIAIVDTPNRLWFTDAHTSREAFYHWLPDDVAVDYAKFTPRENFNSAFERSDGDSFLRLARYGRGVSYHEFIISLGCMEKINVVSSMQSFFNWKSHKFKYFLKDNGPVNMHDGFYEEALYIALRKQQVT